MKYITESAFLPLCLIMNKQCGERKLFNVRQGRSGCLMRSVSDMENGKYETV